MKMRLTLFLAFAMLSISILSYGVNGSAFAGSHDIGAAPNPLSVSSDTELYANGSNVTISGNIKDYDPSSQYAGAITYQVITPDGLSRVAIGQLIPNSDGSFQFNFIAGGPYWKVNGDYTVETKYGADKIELTINYVGGELVVTGTEPKTCGSNETLINGVCVENEPASITCGSNETLINGVCVENEPASITCGSNETLINGVCVENEPELTCGAGTELVNGICKVVQTEEPEANGGGCLIATAAYGTELAPQVQFLREIRDNTVMSTASGTAFMTGFNQLYYSFSPTIADMERENPMFQEVVRVFITPMVSTLSIMTLAEDGSEVEVLGLGISVIALNLGMYIAAPALIGFKIHNHLKSRK